MKDICERCGGVLELCPACYPWTIEHYICTECDCTFGIDAFGKVIYES